MKDTITVFIVLGAISRFARFGLVSAYYSLYLKHAGLDLLEINMVNVCYYVALFLCEIPTGAFADVYGRKKSFVVAHCIGGVAMFLYGTSSHFWQFACAEIITALGVTFASGAFEAWLVDTLKHEGNTTPLQKVFGRNEYWRQGSVLLGSLTGSLIAEYDMRVPWMIGGVGELLVAFFAARYMREVYFQKKSFALISGYKEMLRTANTSVRYGLQSPVIRYIMIVAALQTFVFMAPNMQWQIWFGESVPIKGWLGYVMAANMLFMMIGSRLAVKLLAKQRNEEWAIMINQAAMGVLLVCTVVIGNLWGLVPFLAHQVFRGFWNPLKEAYLHDHIESRDRATIVSFESVMYHMAGAAGLVVSGFLGKQYGILTTWILVGGFLSIGTVGVYWLRKK